MSAYRNRPPRLPLSVWPTAQRSATAQRRGRYLPASTAHPAKMLPATAARAVASFSVPGDVVADPMCGIGTTLVEAAHLGRHALGVEYEYRWAHLARANLDHARAHGAAGAGEVIVGDARDLADLVDTSVWGRVALVVTSPPYGAHTHGHVRTSRNSRRGGVHKWDHRYSRDPANLAHRNPDELLTGLTAILAGCHRLLRDGGIAVVTARPYRLSGVLVDLPAQVFHAAADAGLEPFDRHVALLCGLRGDRLVPRGSFFAMHEVRKNRARGLPAHVIAHEDILILRKPETAGQRFNRAATDTPADPFGLGTDVGTGEQLEEWAA